MDDKEKPTRCVLCGQHVRHTPDPDIGWVHVATGRIGCSREV